MTRAAEIRACWKLMLSILRWESRTGNDSTPVASSGEREHAAGCDGFAEPPDRSFHPSLSHDPEIPTPSRREGPSERRADSLRYRQAVASNRGMLAVCTRIGPATLQSTSRPPFVPRATT